MSKKKFFKTKKMKQIKKQVLDEYALEKVEMLGSSGNFDTSKCKDKKENFYILKIRREKSKHSKEKFLKEIFVNQILSKNKNSKIEFPNFINSQFIKKPEWLIYQYVEGYSVGQWNYFYSKDLNKIFDNLQHIILTLLKIKINNKKFKPIKYKEIFDSFKKYQKILKFFFTKDEIKKGKKIIEENKKLLNKTKLVLTHGDLHPANIIITNNNKLSLIDWYDVQLNNFAFDTTYLWFKLWNYPEKQNNFLKNITKNIKNKKEFEVLFKINQVRLTPKMLEVAKDVRTSLSKNQKKEIVKTEALINWLINNYKNII